MSKKLVGKIYMADSDKKIIGIKVRKAQVPYSVTIGETVEIIKCRNKNKE